MKMKPEHYTILERAIKPLDTRERRERYLRGEFSRSEACHDRDMRYRWDLLHVSCVKIGDGVGMGGLPLYGYLDDEHIDTALRRIVPVLADQEVAHA